MSLNEFIWEPLPSLPSKPDLFGWPGGDSDSEDINETNSSKSNTNTAAIKATSKEPSGNVSLTGLSSTSDGISAENGHNTNPQSSTTNSSTKSSTHPQGLVTGSTNCNNETSVIRDFAHAGHSLTRKSFRRPVTCQHCSETMWGIMPSGLVCDVCNFVIHEKCVPFIVTLCTTISSTVIARPLSHCWSDPMNLKKKICNVCRKRMDDGYGVKCEICGYFSHVDCQDYVVNDCKEGATYSPNMALETWKPKHHWREGNLPRGSRCAVCRRNCHTSECLTGFRCEWCDRRVHSACLRSIGDRSCSTNINHVCDLGPLQSIILPPCAVSLPRTSLASVHSIFGVTNTHNRGRNPSDDWSDEESKDDSFIDKRTSKENSEKEGSEEIIRVFDGNGSIRRRVYRSFPFHKTMTTQAAIEQSLRSFHIFGKTDEYCIIEINEQDGTENKLDDKLALKSQLKFDQRRPTLVLKPKEFEVDRVRGKLKIYPGDLINYAQVTSKFKEIPINRETTAKEVLIMALRRFHCEDIPLKSVQMVEVCLDRHVTERIVNNEERPWEIIQRIRHESIRALRLSRFYLRINEANIISKSLVSANHKLTQFASSASSSASSSSSSSNCVSLFVCNLVENLNQNVYEKMLIDKIGHDNKWDKIDVIYYEYGCLVLIYNNVERAEASYEILKETEIKDRAVMVMILPRILPSLIPENVTPLLVLVNLKSGGCQGAQLISSFRRALNPHQVFNLEYGGPLPGLYCFRQVPKYRILVCGGDGTVGWALSCLDNTSQDAACHSPPIAVLPLGTGNDLARVLHWGGGYSSAEDPINILKDVVSAEEIKLDRWTLVVKSDDPDKDEAKMALQLETNTLHTNEDSSLLIIMNNYFGIGLDADLALDFHLARSGNPEKFNSRIHNKTVYLQLGLRKMVFRSACKDLHKKIIVEADGRQIEIPPVEGLIVLNIMSWGAGASPWGSGSMEHDDMSGGGGGSQSSCGGSGGASGTQGGGGGSSQRFKVPTHHDGLLEVLGVCGMLHMGQIYSGIRSGIRICQAGHLKITLKTDLPVQVDGEPFIQSPGTITVLKSALHAIMLKKSKRSARQRSTEQSAISNRNQRDQSKDGVLSDTNNSLNTNE